MIEQIKYEGNFKFSAAGRSMLEHGYLAIESSRRHTNHTISEFGTDVDVIMDSISSDESITWCRQHAFASRGHSEPGTIRLDQERDTATVRKHTEERLSNYVCMGMSEMTTEINSDWYGFVDPSLLQQASSEKGENGVNPTVAFFVTDGDKGISGEISYHWSDGIWAQGPDTARTTVHNTMLDAIRNQDVEGIVSVMGEKVQGSTRDYFKSGDPFVVLDGIEAHREYWNKFFANADVVSVNPILRVVKHYLFCELMWELRLKDGREMAMRTAEWVVFDGENKIVAHGGYGTEMEPTYLKK